MSKTTVVIDDRLLDDAMKAVAARTKRAAIEAGLRELIRKRNREALRRELGTYDLDLTFRDLDRMRSGE